MTPAEAAPPLWTAAGAAAATGVAAVGDWAASGVSIDSRSLAPGDLFVALRDERDGHDFVEAAFAAGAAAALTERDMGRPGLVVPDVVGALERLGAGARARTQARIAAVTGSVGKTSVKEMLARIFRAAGPAHWSEKSFNNHWGVPLTLARMPAATRHAVFEIGMNTPGEIAPRSRLVRPHAAMITKIAPAHLEGMGSIDAVAEEKSDIFAGLLPGGAAILPAADRFFGRLRVRALTHEPSARLLSFGAPDADAAVLDYASDGMGSTVRLLVLGAEVQVRLDAVGDHWGENAALALLAAAALGIDPRDAAEALDGYAPPAGRGAASGLFTERGERFTLVDDSYNANPESMRAALAGFGARPGRRIVVLGEMRELGPEADALHAALAGPVLETGAALVILSGAGMAPLAGALAARGAEVVHRPDAEAALAELKTHLKGDDAVLLKGSNASGLGRIGAALRAMSAAVQGAQKAAGA